MYDFLSVININLSPYLTPFPRYGRLLGRPTSVGKALSFTHKLFFLFYQSTALSSNAVDGRQMYFGGLVVGKALAIGIEISPTPPLIFTWLKTAKFGVVFNITQL